MEHFLFERVWLCFPVSEGNGDLFVEHFGSQRFVDIPEISFGELTLDFEQVKGMKTEVA